MSKKEYIERGAVLKTPPFTKYGGDSSEYAEGYLDCIEEARNAVNDAPAADVVEVRHGEWIESTHWGEWYYDCPFCDDGFAKRGRCETLPNFCSNCGAKLTGAKMDGERKE